jgi:hypothetical protein
MWLILTLLACGEPDVPVKTEDIVNTWWCTVDNGLAFYLQKFNGNNKAFYTYWDEDPELEHYIHSGSWSRIDSNKFEIDYENKSYVVKATKEGSCYKVHVSIFGDLACKCSAVI